MTGGGAPDPDMVRNQVREILGDILGPIDEVDGDRADAAPQAS